MKRQLERLWDLPAAFLLMVVIFSASVRLSVTNWTPRLGIAGIAAFLGIALGLALGYSQFRRRAVSLLALGYTAILVPWLLSLTIQEETVGLQRYASLFGRLGFSIGQVGNRQPVQDPLFFTALMTVLFWTIALLGGYFLVRKRNLLVALIPPGITILVVQGFDSHNTGRIWLVAFFLFAVLLLLGRINYLKNRADWRERHIQVQVDSGFDLNTGILVSAAAVILLAWSIPTSYTDLTSGASLWRDLTEPFNSLRERFSDMFAATSGAQPIGYDFYGENLPLGRNVIEGDDIIFSVEAPAGIPPVRYYWRTRVYDVYQDGFWTSSTQREQPFLPDQGNLSVPDSNERRIAEFTFTTRMAQQSTFFTYAQPVWVSRPADLISYPTPTLAVDLVSFRADPVLRAGDVYQLRTSISNPTVADLRRTGETYPGWVTERYLQLPDDLSELVVEKAVELTAGLTTPYDKAVAITEYLRREIRYTTSVPAPPPNRDVLEWLLFTWQRGYCNYYASAEVVMLRAVGMPARMAVGFAEGERETDGSYSVRRRDAHAWPEVYFPGFGWVEFEPTFIQPELVRPSGPQIFIPGIGSNQPAVPDPGSEDSPGGAAASIPPEDITDETALQAASVQRLWAAWALGLSLTALLVLLAARLGRRFELSNRMPRWITRYYRRRGWEIPVWILAWQYRASLGPIERAFEVINQGLRWMKEPAPAYATPAERAAALTELVPRASSEISLLAAEYQAMLYSPQPGDPLRAQKASSAIRLQTILTLIYELFVPPTRNLTR